ncbi:MAG: F0F1 ATP synthase subunit B [Paraprevotella sp.]|nr:F0F1 ATP synthase subunit B [Paraprevotella sp.]
MGLLTPDPGTLFWMVIIFGFVFFILAKYAFPVIINMVDKRKKYIDSSLEAARQANEQLQQVKAESEALLAQARENQTTILKEASATRDRIIAEARERARVEAEKALDETRHQIAAEKESAINDIRRQVAILSVDVAEKILREKLSDNKEQLDLVNRLIDEVKSNNEIG